MNESQFRAAVEAMKAREQPEDIFPLTQDRTLVSGMLAWRNVPVRFEEGDESDDDPWSSVAYRVADFARASGLGTAAAKVVFEVLRANRLVYPDGTVHRYGRQYARALMVDVLQHKGKGK